MTRERILVYAPSWIGDAVMSLGAIRVLRRASGDAEIVVLARPWVSELYDALESVDARIDYDSRGSDRGLHGLAAAASRVRSQAFDACLLLPSAFRAAAFVRLAGIRERWGYATEGRGFLLTRRVSPAPRPFGRHQSYFYLELMAGLGFEAGEPDLKLRATESMKRKARELLEVEGWDGTETLVGVHPGATNSRAKLWLPGRFARVASRLAEAMGARVVVLGGPGEEELARRVGEELDEPPLVLSGKTSVGALMGAIDSLSLFLSNDSGPMHLAAALGTPTVAVFGPTDPRETGPFGERARVVRERVECSPCIYRDCPIDHRCMERVDVERVVDAARTLVAAGDSSPIAREAARR